MKTTQKGDTIILTVEKGIAIVMADELENMGITVDEVVLPNEQRKAEITIPVPADKADTEADYAGVVDAVAHTILKKLFTAENEE